MDQPQVPQNDRYQTIILSASAAIMTIVLPDWKYNFANPAAISMFAVENELEFLKLTPWELSPDMQPDGQNSHEKAIAMLEKAMKDGFHTFEWLHKKWNGENFYTEVLLTRVGEGSSMFVNAIVTDISERKKVELKLKESEERLRKAQRVAQVGNWELDLQTKKIWASEEAFTIYGIERTGQYLPLEIVQQKVLPEFRLTLDAALSALIDEGKEYSVEFRIKKNNGSIVDVHSWAELSKDSTGKPVKVVGVIQDITAMKKTQSSLRESQLILQNIIDLLPVRIFWKDLNLHYLGCNTVFAKDAGKNVPADVIGNDDYEMGWKDQADLYREDDKKVISTGISKLNYEEPQTTPTGENWLITNKMPLTDNTGKIIGVLGTYQDITQLKHAETELTAKNKELEELNNSMVNRELKMIELKNKIEELEGKS